MYYPDADDTNKWLGEVQKKYPGKFVAFADIRKESSYFIEDAPYCLEDAVKEYGLAGLKVHPNNLQLDADSLEMVPVLRKAADLKVPVMIHSNPCRVGFQDNCAPDRINKMVQIFPRFFRSLSVCTELNRQTAYSADSVLTDLSLLPIIRMSVIQMRRTFTRPTVIF